MRYVDTMMQEICVMCSAPYMIPVVDRFHPLFEAADIKLLVPEVLERMEEKDLMTYAGKVDGVICGDDRFSGQVLAAFAPRLKVISKWGTGIDSIDKAAAEKLGMQVCRTVDAFTTPVSDTVLQYMLLFARQGVVLDRAMKAGDWHKVVGRSLAECTVGVIGIGHIGSEVLRKAGVFGPRLLGNDIVEIPEEKVQRLGVEMLPLEDLLHQSDFVSINCDLNPTSRHLINEEALQILKPGAYLINTARGPIVAEEDLIAALQSGHLAGAALDVFEDEPLPEDSPLRSMDNVFLAPHNSNSSPTAWERVHWNTLRNLFDGLGIDMPDESLVLGKHEI